MFKKNKLTQQCEHLLFNQNLVYLFRMNLYNWMVKYGVTKELNKRLTKALNRLFFDRDRLFRPHIDLNLRNQIPGALVFDYYAQAPPAKSLTQLEPEEKGEGEEQEGGEQKAEGEEQE